ncbi:MAG TPA: AAA family ATPase [Tepidisphaeraceae bacterium]|nr:AAA family ATPase [Tepidisphaeraceae bacterium]
MRLSSVRIQNFRAFADQTIHFNDYTCLVGPNGGGKSTVLMALNIFFQETSHAKTDLLRLDKEDFHHKNTSDPVIITVTFEDLSAEAQEDLKDYYRQGKLIVSAKAIWTEEDKYAQVLQYGQRLGMEAFKPFFKAEGDGASVRDLKTAYVEIREKHPDLPAPGAKQAMIDALHGYESTHATKCVEIPSEDQFYGISKGVNRLEKHVQWVFVPAVKDASDEQIEAKKTALGTLLERTVRTKVAFTEPLGRLRAEAGKEYQRVLDEQQAALKELSDSLSHRLGEWAHPDASVALEWRNDEQTSIKIAEPLAQIIASEGQFKGKLARFGHGLQRSFLLALLEELSGNAAQGPKLILGCEEPEVYQHPPQVRHLASIFQRLSTKNSQVIVCTHSPYFVSGREVEDVRSIRADPATKTCRCNHVTLNQISASLAAARGELAAKSVGTMLKVEQALQPALNEIFFTNALILVEGLEDVAYIATYLTLTARWDSFRKLGCHLVPAGGKSSIAQPLAIAQHLKIPTFVVFDSDGHSCNAADGDTPQQTNKKNDVRPKHEKDNVTILKLCGAPHGDLFPAAALWHDNVVMWHSEIGLVVAEDFGTDEWAKIADAVRAKHGIEVKDINKNSLFIGYRLAEAWELNKKSPTLERLCKAIIDFATAARKPPAPAVPAAAVEIVEAAK